MVTRQNLCLPLIFRMSLSPAVHDNHLSAVTDPPPAAQSPGRSLDHDLRNECWCGAPHTFPLSCSFFLVGRPSASRLPFQHLPPALSSVGRREPGVGLEPYMFLSLMYKCWWASVPFMKEGKCVWRTRGLPRLRNRLFFLLALY